MRGGKRNGAGRKPGSKDRDTREILERIQALGCDDPLIGMAKIAKNKKCSIALRLKAYTELAGYVYSKRKAIELSTGGKRLVFEVRHIGRKPDTLSP